MSKRILGHLRIFQSVQADLNMGNEWQDSRYTYEGVDPFQLEDSAFPITVNAIERYGIRMKIEMLEELENEAYGKDAFKHTKAALRKILEDD